MHSFKKQFLSSHSSFSRAIQYLKANLQEGKAHRPSKFKIMKFVFLCGANRDNGTRISLRREELLKFIDTNFPYIKVFIAEEIFDLLKKEGHSGNILDIEDEISKFADEIVIVLESSSAFCELGAFATKGLRPKLIIINEETHKQKQSFINLGPLQAIKETSGGKKRILHYKMDYSSKSVPDSIGQIFSALKKVLQSIPIEKPGTIHFDTFDPKKSFGKDTMRFIHDLIFFSEPIRRKEIIEILKALFGPGEYKRITNLLGLLRAISLVEMKGPENYQYYVSKEGKELLNYKFNLDFIISSFRNYPQKHTQERFHDIKA